MSNTIIPEPGPARDRIAASTDENPFDRELDHPSVEPWLRTSFLALVPLILAFYLPEEWQPHLFVAGGLLLVTAAAMLVRQERRKSTGRRE